MNRKIIPLIVFNQSLLHSFANCNMPPISLAPGNRRHTTTPTGTIPWMTPTDTAPPPFATAELGLAENPLILALPPTANTQEQIDAAKDRLPIYRTNRLYGCYDHPRVIHSLVDALEKGNAHIVVLDPYAYELAYQRGLVQASYAVLRDGEGHMGRTVPGSRKGGFTSYFDEGIGENLDEAPVALRSSPIKSPAGPTRPRRPGISSPWDISMRIRS